MKTYTQSIRYISSSGRWVTMTITYEYEEGKAPSVATTQIKHERD
jgi:hypothetical protein